ncbi:MAG: hypothetical protein ACTSXT_06865 [Candidatus Helarchaeota archaeon]
MNLINKIKDELSENFYLLIMITGIWITLICLFLFIKIYVTNLTPNVTIVTPIAEKFWDLITAAVQFLLALVYIVGGLYIWYKIIKIYFWRRMKKSGQVKEEKNDIIIEE